MRPEIDTGRQEGMVMLIAVIMLLAVTLMIMSASNLVQTDLKVVGNMESRLLVGSFGVKIRRRLECGPG